MQKTLQQLLFAVATIGLLIGGMASAHSADESVTKDQSQAVEKRPGQVKSQNIGAEKKAAVKLSAKQLENCTKHEAKIKEKMANVSARGQKHLEVFTKIADRTDAFYASKERPVADYEKLAAEVEAKKKAAEAAILETSDAALAFSCDAADPKASVKEFKNLAAAQVQALKDYRTAIKNLIVAVKSAQSQATKNGEVQ